MTSASDPLLHVEPPLWAAPTASAPVRTQVRLPGSKSLTNRALVLAAVAQGPSTVRSALRSRDTTLMAGALTALGAPVDAHGDDWTVTPGTATGDVTVDCGLAGTVMRFVPGVAALGTASATFDGDPHARTRPMGQVLGGLSALGVDVDDAGRGALPFTVRGHGSVRGGQVQIDASSSSQFVSALLLVGARFDQGVDVRHVGEPVPSLPHIEMTVAELRRRGVEVADDEPARWRVHPGPVSGIDVTVEPDLSNAAPFLALALVSGGEVTIADWPGETTQAGDALRDLLAQMGAVVTRGEAGRGLTVAGPGLADLRGLDADLHDVGELTPVLAALCALAGTPSQLRGVAHIRGHETDRLAALARELGGLGADVTETEDGLALRPAALGPGVFHTYADHRMAHAGALLGAAVAGVLVEDVATTAKTFPGFEAVWSGLVA